MSSEDRDDAELPPAQPAETGGVPVPPAAPKPTRRTFMAMTVGGAVTVAGAAGLSWWISHINDRGELEELEPAEPMSETGEVLAGLLRERLNMLELPDATISKWVNRYEKHRKPWKGKKLSRKDLQNFLLSTDFFPAADESKPLHFVAYYDPYISVCYNPLRHA